jgi:hypothetical protein
MDILAYWPAVDDSRFGLQASFKRRNDQRIVLPAKTFATLSDLLFDSHVVRPSAPAHFVKFDSSRMMGNCSRPSDAAV